MVERVNLASYLAPTFCCAILYSVIVIYCSCVGLSQITDDSAFQLAREVKQTWLSPTIQDVVFTQSQSNCPTDYKQLFITTDSDLGRAKLKFFPITLQNGESKLLRLCQKEIQKYTFQQLYEKTVSNCTSNTFQGCQDESQNYVVCTPKENQCPISQIKFRSHDDNQTTNSTVFPGFDVIPQRYQTQILYGLTIRAAGSNNYFMASTELQAPIQQIFEKNGLEYSGSANYQTEYALYVEYVTQMLWECGRNPKFLDFLKNEGWANSMEFYQKAGIVLNLFFLGFMCLLIYVVNPLAPDLSIQHPNSLPNNRCYSFKYLSFMILASLIQIYPIVQTLQQLQDVMDFTNVVYDGRCMDHQDFSMIVKRNRQYIQSCMSYNACNVGFYIVGIGALLWNWWGNYQDFLKVMDNQRQEEELNARSVMLDGRQYDQIQMQNQQSARSNPSDTDKKLKNLANILKINQNASNKIMDDTTEEVTQDDQEDIDVNDEEQIDGESVKQKKKKSQPKKKVDQIIQRDSSSNTAIDKNKNQRIKLVEQEEEAQEEEQENHNHGEQEEEDDDDLKQVP